jgi:hypothetical protein
MTLELAQQIGDTNYRLAALWGLWIERLNSGAFRDAHRLARQFSDIAEGSPDTFDLIMADRLLGTSLHYLGEQEDARRHFDRMFGRGAGPLSQMRITRFQSDQGVTTRYFQARALWLLGYPEQAIAAADANVEEARSKGLALTLSSALGQGACPIALFTGDLDAADRFGAMLLKHSERHALHLWTEWARCFIAIVKVQRGDIATGLPALKTELDRIGERIVLPRYLLLLSELAVSLGKAGETAQALAAVDKMLERCERNEELWSIAELYRVKGELIILEGGRGEDHFHRSLEWAERQGALAWKLRTAISLARRWRDSEKAREGYGLLSQTYEAFSEGFETADLKTARQLMTEMRPHKSRKTPSGNTGRPA